MDENIDVFKQRLAKAVEIFNEQKQTINELKNTIADLKLINNELKHNYELSTEDNEKLVKRIKELKLELEKLSKDQFVNVDTATSALKKQKENSQNISINRNCGTIFTPTPGNITI